MTRRCRRTRSAATGSPQPAMPSSAASSTSRSSRWTAASACTVAGCAATGPNTPASSASARRHAAASNRARRRPPASPRQRSRGDPLSQAIHRQHRQTRDTAPPRNATRENPPGDDTAQVRRHQDTHRSKRITSLDLRQPPAAAPHTPAPRTPSTPPASLHPRCPHVTCLSNDSLPTRMHSSRQRSHGPQASSEAWDRMQRQASSATSPISWRSMLTGFTNRQGVNRSQSGNHRICLQLESHAFISSS